MLSPIVVAKEVPDLGRVLGGGLPHFSQIGRQGTLTLEQGVHIHRRQRDLHLADRALHRLECRHAMECGVYPGTRQNNWLFV